MPNAFTIFTTSMSDIIFLNGTSSSGKSTIAHALREKLPSFSYFASDQLAEAGFRPLTRTPEERERFFAGFHYSIAAFADAGSQLIVEHIVESIEWAQMLQLLLSRHQVFWVGVQAPQEELQRREIARGDRGIGEALYHLRTHDFVSYDLNVDSTKAPEENALTIVGAWSQWQSSFSS